MKKVLFIGNIKNHFDTFHTPFFKLFKDNSWEVHVAAKNDGKDRSDQLIDYCDCFFDIPITRAPLKKQNIDALRKLKKIINDSNYDIIHCHTPVGGVLGRLASRDARKKGTKVMYTAHGFHFYTGAPLINWVAYYTIEKLLANLTDTLITINSEDYERAKSFKVQKVESVHGVGVDLNKINSVSVDRALTLKELEIPINSFILLSVGELNKNKNHKLVIKALADLKDDTVHYLICGNGFFEQDLMNLTQELRIDKQVHFLGFRKDVIRFCKTSDIFIFPSLREGLPVSVMEAMASGLPILASKIRGNIDLVDEDLGGLFFDPNNPDELKNQIVQLKNDGIKRENFGEYNQRKIILYSVTNVLNEMKLIYNLHQIDSK